MSNMSRVLLNFDPAELARVRTLAEASDAPVAAIVRRAVAAYLDRSDRFTRLLAEAEALEPGFVDRLEVTDLIVAAHCAGLL